MFRSAAPPPEYYGEFLQRLLSALAAPAGAVWGRTPQGNLKIENSINVKEVGLEQVENGQECHAALLRQVVQQGRPVLAPPQSGPGVTEGANSPANLSNFVLLVAPIFVDKQVAGLIEDLARPGAVAGSPARLPELHAQDGRVRRRLHAEHAAPADDGPAASLDPARSLHSPDSRQPQPPRSRLSDRQRRAKAHRLRSRQRRRSRRRARCAWKRSAGRM